MRSGGNQRKVARVALVLLSCVMLLSACESEDPVAGKRSAPEMPEFDGAQLAAGRSVWMGTCRNCHLLGISGAPAVTDQATWEKRLQKGRRILTRNALTGIRDDAGATRMPPRGGNERLTDEQVRLAVNYMLASVRYFAERRRQK